MSEVTRTVYLDMCMSILEVLKEEIGLARGVSIAEAIWRRFGTKIRQYLSDKFQIKGDTISGIANLIKLFYTDILNFPNVQVTGKEIDDSHIVTIKDCPIWKAIKDNRLPPLCHKAFCNGFVETITRELNPGVIFNKGAEYRQGADRCEFEWKKF